MDDLVAKVPFFSMRLDDLVAKVGFERDSDNAVDNSLHTVLLLK